MAGDEWADPLDSGSSIDSRQGLTVQYEKVLVVLIVGGQTITYTLTYPIRSEHHSLKIT